MKSDTIKHNGPRYWKSKADESAAEGLARMKALEGELIKKKKLKSITLPDGCLICATKERLAYLLEIYCPKPSTKNKNRRP